MMLCLKCGKENAKQGGLCANCMMSTNITDTLDPFSNMPKVDIPTELFFGPSASNYLILKNNSAKNSRYVLPSKKYDITTLRNGIDTATLNKKNSIDSLLRYNATTTASNNAKPNYVFAAYKIPTQNYSLNNKSSYGITLANGYALKPTALGKGPYASLIGKYASGHNKNSYSKNSAKGAYSGSTAKGSYSGSSAKGSSSASSSK